jgi:hypothetical protein|tara:strand:+ start:439 stop:618 length:180 start_codon:yes stop_codon:yes gene_type:complete
LQNLNLAILPLFTEFQNFIAHEKHNEKMYDHQKHEDHPVAGNFDTNYQKDNFQWDNFQL